MIICIEYDEKLLGHDQAFQLIDTVRSPRYGFKIRENKPVLLSSDEVDEILGEEGSYKITLTKSKLVNESYTIEQIA